MATPVDFFGPFLKTERAQHHIAQLEDIFRRYKVANTKALLSHRYRQMRERPAPIGAAFPRHTPTVLGDALHNLRASLDHAYCILVQANGGAVNQYTRFPFTEKGTRKDLEGSVRGQAKAGSGPSDKIIDLIFNEIEPFPGGKGTDLIALHVLDIADKHLVLLPIEQHTFLEDVRFEGGGGFTNITLVTSGAPAIAFGPGAGLKQDYNNKASVEICFGRGQPFEGKPVLPTLRTIARSVRQALSRLEEVVNS